MNAAHSVAVLVVNFRSHHLLDRNLSDLRSPGIQIIVVDNFSDMLERRQIESLGLQRGWTVIGLDQNVGYGEANNVAARRAIERGAEVLVLLNPDASILPIGVQELAQQVRQDPRAMISPLILNPDGSTWFGGSRVDVASGRFHRVSNDFDLTSDTRLTGACLAVSSLMWEELGGFGGDYFMYWEDVDLSWRCRESGGRLRLIENVSVIHDSGGTQRHATDAEARSPLYFRYNSRNRLLFAARNLSTGRLLEWIVRTPVESFVIVAQQGRRQLVRRPVIVWAGIRGSLEGLGLAAAELGRRGWAARVSARTRGR